MIFSLLLLNFVYCIYTYTMTERIKKLRAIVCDIDGVLTDGSILVMPGGAEGLIRAVDAKDMFALRYAALQGLVTGIISGGKSDALEYRCMSVGVKPENLFLGARGKLALFKEFCAQNQLEPQEVAYFGDDIPDTQVLRSCFGIAPADAAPEARQAASFVTEHSGGRGAVREGIEMILKAQGKWVFDEDKYDLIY